MAVVLAGDGDSGSRAEGDELRGWLATIDRASPWLFVVLGVSSITVLAALGAVGEPGEWTWSARVGIVRDADLARRAPGSAVHLIADSFYGLLYTLTAFVGFRLTVRHATAINDIDQFRYAPFARRVSGWGLVGFVYVTIGCLADWTENALTWWISRGSPGPDSTQVMAVTSAAWVKWLAVVAGFTVVVLTIGSAITRARDLKTENAGRDPAPEWRGGRHRHPREFDTAGPRTGVSLSGGGIRSAAFSLGALQAISRSSLSPIRYITSVSGGGYMAAAWASLSRSGADKAPFRPRSVEERWVRHHTDYLVASGGVMVGAAVALVSGLLLNLALVILVLQAAAHPLGWLINATHPELRAHTPLIEVREQPEVAIDGVSPAPDAVITPEDGSTGEPAERAYRVRVSVEEPPVLATAASVTDVPRVQPAPALTVREGLVIETSDGLVVARQPVLTGVASLFPNKALRVVRQPELTLRDVDDGTGASTSAAALSGAEVEELLEIDQPLIRQFTGTVGRKDLDVPRWIWGTIGGLGAAVVVSWLLDGRWRRETGLLAGSNRVTSGVAKLAAGAVVLLVLLPWMASGLPTWIRNLPGYDATATGWRAVGAFVLAVLSLVWRLRGSVADRLPALRRFRGRGYIIDAAVGAVVITVLLAMFGAFVDLAAANGPNGRLRGIHDRWTPDAPDWQRWAAATAILIVLLAVPVASHAWSLYTFYRSRLVEGYMLKREGTGVVPVRGKALHAWQWATVAPDGAPAGVAEPPDGPASAAAAMPSSLLLAAPAAPSGRKSRRPRSRGGRGPDVGAIEEWVVCTAVNIRGSGEAAPGRAAGSFSFSRSWIGGPEVGWIRTAEYLERLGPSRRRDVSVPSTVTISGAAFSPAMGKMSKPWQGRLLALGNLRLGVWVPNPMVVRLGRDYGRWRSPNAAWYLRELIGWFDRTAPYVYLTDGGHWENLGLVELLRRGCTDIWMISAAGDGTGSFETLGQAFALAREEVGVEFHVLDLEELRPGGGDGAPDQRTIMRVARSEQTRKKRRLMRDGVEAPTAGAGFVRGTFTYGDGKPGTITIVEAALLADLPWDVHSYAEHNLDFPDISTGYQLMDHRDFEAYRMLGYIQTTRALESAGMVTEGAAGDG